MKTLTWSQNCQRCEGKGLVHGWAEAPATAVVCPTCNGEGEKTYTHEYQDFTGLLPLEGVHTVFRINPGINLANSNPSGGVAISEWNRDPESVNRPGAEMRRQVCPAWWYNKADQSLMPNWPECKRSQFFSKCPSFPQKENCWNRWDVENNVQPNTT